MQLESETSGPLSKGRPSESNALVKAWANLITYSRGYGKHDNTPRQMVADSFAEFADAVLSDRATAKGQQWVSGAFNIAPDDAAHSGTQSKCHAIGKPHRCKQCAQPRRFIGLDIDQGMTPDSLRALVGVMGEWSSLIYTTASHKPEAPRVRVIVELDLPAPRAELIAASVAIRGRIDKRMVVCGFAAIPWDAGTDKPEQPLYLPVRESETFRSIGPPAVLADLLADVTPTKAPQRGNLEGLPAAPQRMPGLHPFIAGAVRSAVQAVASGPKDNRNNTLNKEAHGLAGFAELSDALILSELGAAARSAGLDPGEIEPTIRSGIASGRLHPREIPPIHPYVPAATDDPWPARIDSDTAHPHTDHANAHRLVRVVGRDMLYVPGLGWLTWSPPWRLDELAVRRRCAHLGRIVASEASEMMAKATEIEDEDKRKLAISAAEARAKWARQCEFKGTIANAQAMAETLLHVRIEQVDADPLLLGCTNGVLDLRTGKLRAHKRTDFLTQCNAVAYDESARAPTWERFVLEVFKGDGELVEWVQRYLGYCLTGLTTEHMLVVAHGTGANGKTTLFECIRQMLGTYGKTAAPGLLVARRGERHPTEILDLRGARLVCSSETGEGGRLAEDLVKQLTGGDGLKGRAMRQDFIDFAPTFKLVLFTNHRPLITGQDNGIWRRIKLVPFLETFEGERKDKDLLAKLKAEWPGILRWCVQGLMRWQREGFNRCAAIENASNQYREESDLLGQFLADECITGPGYTETSTELYRSYVEWCKDNGVQPLGKRTLGMRMQERGLVVHRGTGGVRRWQGLKLGHPVEVSRPWAA